MQAWYPHYDPILTCRGAVLVDGAAGRDGLEPRHPMGEGGLHPSSMADPRLSVPLSKVVSVVGAGLSRTHVLHGPPGVPKHCLCEVNWITQLYRLRGRQSSSLGLPLELLRRVLPSRHHQLALMRQLHAVIPLEAKSTWRRGRWRDQAVVTRVWVHTPQHPVHICAPRWVGEHARGRALAADPT